MTMESALQKSYGVSNVYNLPLKIHERKIRTFMYSSYIYTPNLSQCVCVLNRCPIASVYVPNVLKRCFTLSQK